jgi:hypothetical protein
MASIIYQANLPENEYSPWQKMEQNPCKSKMKKSKQEYTCQLTGVNFSVKKYT